MATRECAQCKTRFDVPNTGRPKKFCSDRCRLVNHRQLQRAKRGLSVPSVLVEEPRWVRHIRKRPVTVEGRAASVTDPATWASLDAATASRVGDGVGFVVGGGVGCVDLDDALDSLGRVRPEAQALLDAAPNTWVEVSPSGRGLHVWGLLPEGPGRVLVVGGQQVEVYSRDRYLTVTGNRFADAPLQLADLSEFVAQLT